MDAAFFSHLVDGTHGHKELAGRFLDNQIPACDLAAQSGERHPAVRVGQGDDVGQAIGNVVGITHLPPPSLRKSENSRQYQHYGNPQR
jgi:hypothetical protein